MEPPNCYCNFFRSSEGTRVTTLGSSITGMATRASIRQRSSRKRHFSSLRIRRLAVRLKVWRG